MKHEALGRLMDRWTADIEFRSALRRDPLAAIESAGLQLSEDEVAAVKAVDWSLSDEELAARTSHMPIV